MGRRRRGVRGVQGVQGCVGVCTGVYGCVGVRPDKNDPKCKMEFDSDSFSKKCSEQPVALSVDASEGGVESEKWCTLQVAHRSFGL